MWLQMSQILKQNYRRERKKISIYLLTLMSQKSEKHTRLFI